MKLISWNVNGLRAVIGKNFHEFVEANQPDILCLQETKAHAHQVALELPGYRQYWCEAEKKGYSGKAVLTRLEPLKFSCGMDIDEHDHEGRVLNLEFADFHLVNVYTPNSQDELRRLAYRQEWDRAFLDHLKKLEATKPVVFCGDLNVAHRPIDLKNPKANERNPGYTVEERAGFERYIESGFIDSFREFNQEPEQYSWWSYRFKAREKNIGWRIDYFLISAALRPRLQEAFILQQVMGSDHCPVGIALADPHS